MLYWTGGNEEKVRTLFLNNGLDDVMYIVVSRLMYSNAFIDNGALPIKARLLRCQRLYVEYLTDSVRVCHGVGGFGCRTTYCLQDYSREPRVRWSQDESIL